MTPVFRLEYFITAAANGTPCDLEPIFNEEKYLHAIAGASVDLPMPIGRTQEYLAKLAGMDVEIPDHPIFRTEYYLAHMIDSTVECPAPIFREEMFYYEWASNEYVTITGNPVSFTARNAPLKQLKVAFSPKQDLHGYDSPWPAGGGKNLLNMAEVVPQGEYLNNGATFTIPSGSITRPKFQFSQTDVDIIVSFGTVSGEMTNPRLVFYDSNENSVGTVNIVSNRTGAFSGVSYVQIDYGSTGNMSIGQPMIRLASVTDSSYAPYSNICPILGWDSLTVEQRGKNLLALPVAYFTIDATLANCFFIKAGTYTFSYSCAETHRSGYRLIDLNGNVLSDDAHKPNSNFPYNASAKAYYAGANQQAGNRNVLLTIVEDCYIRVVSNQNATGGGFTSAQLELATTASPYQPYNPSSRTISISIGAAVYSGTVDVVTGVVTVTHKRILLGDQIWQNTSSGIFRVANGITDMKTWGTYYHALSWWCNIFKIGTTNSSPQNNCEITTTINSGTIRARYDAIQGDAAAFKAMLEEHNAELVYELAEPLTIQLTPQEVNSLAGDNTMWSDANGDLTVEYRSN